MKKAWGDTQPVLRRDDLHIDLIQVKAGGYSSWHKHRYKSNTFFVIVGGLAVQTRPDPADRNRGFGDVFGLTPGSRSYTITAATWHRFRAQVDTIAIEVYRPSLPESPSLDEDDIFRHDLGGVDPPGCRKTPIEFDEPPDPSSEPSP